MSFFSLHRRRCSGALFPLLGLCAALAASLGGCASVSDAISPAFVDPARYELYDCKQLASERKGLVNRLADLQRLMDKAETGTGGVVVSEVVYRNDYISARGQMKLLDEAWRKNRCRESDIEAATPPAQPTPLGAPAKPPAPGAKSGSAIH